MTEQTPALPVLEAPGAGLPRHELFIARHIVFPLACRRLTWASAARRFQDEGQRVLSLWDSWPAGRLGEQVLIRRIPGIEDSSRYWSAAMTVEHLNIVGTAIRQTIASLRRGVIPNRVARVQDVKPRGVMAPAEVRETFVRMLTDAAADTEPPIPRGQGPCFNHPWFGPISAFRWHCLLGIHQRLHRRQLEAILRELSEAPKK